MKLKINYPLDIMVSEPSVSLPERTFQEVITRMGRLEENVTDVFFNVQSLRRTFREAQTEDGTLPMSEDTYKAMLTSSDNVYDGKTLRDVRVCVQALRLRRFRRLDFDEGDIEIWPGLYLTQKGVEVIRDIHIKDIDVPAILVPTRTPEGALRSMESRDKERFAAYIARDTLKDFLAQHENRLVLRNIRQGATGERVFADIDVGGQDVAEWLIRNGHAKRYLGGTKPDWGWGA